MAGDERFEDLKKGNGTQNAQSISLHAFSDLSHVSPLMFLYLLKESYICGEFQILYFMLFKMLSNIICLTGLTFIEHALLKNRSLIVICSIGYYIELLVVDFGF